MAVTFLLKDRNGFRGGGQARVPGEGGQECWALTALPRGSSGRLAPAACWERFSLREDTHIPISAPQLSVPHHSVSRHEQ